MDTTVSIEWMHKCFICGEPIDGEPTIVRSIVTLEKYPDHADPEYVHTYPACAKCIAEGTLV